MSAHAKRFATLAFAALMLVGASALPVLAEEKSGKAEFDIVPYLWGAGLEGTVGIGRLPSQGVEANFSDIFSNLNFAAMGTFAVRKGDWGAIIDAIYIDLDDTVPTSDEAVYGQAEVSLGEQMYSGLVTYRIFDAGKTTIDLGWGGRARPVRVGNRDLVGLAGGRTRRGASVPTVVVAPLRRHRRRWLAAHLGSDRRRRFRLQ